jgi:hypothetical protein
VTTSSLPGLESRDAKENETGRSATASRSLGAGAGSHDADAGDAAEASPAEGGEEEIEITPEMIYEGVEEFSTQDLDIEDKDDVVKRIYRAMELRRRQRLAPPH